MGANQNLVDYALYDRNDKNGRVPFLDDGSARRTLAADICNILGVTP
jgi:hypothetical protein